MPSGLRLDREAGMSDIFISYASADRERAMVIAQALGARGWSAAQAVPASGRMNVSWRDHARGFRGTFAWTPSSALLQVSISDLRTGLAIGNYSVPALVSQIAPTDYVVSAQFAVPGDSTTPGPHTHYSRLLFRAQRDGSVQLVQNCPRPGECY
jgi:hypothetical protein